MAEFTEETYNKVDNQIDISNAYIDLFNSELGAKVLKDLRYMYSFNLRSMYSNDVNTLLVNEGSREVYNYIINRVNGTYLEEELEEKEKEEVGDELESPLI